MPISMASSNGRVNAIAIVNSAPNIAYAGMPVGGLWKTTNCCSASTIWQSLWDSPDLKSQSVGAIAIDPTNPNVVYVGTGDSQVPAFDMYGNGIYKSTDGGATWIQMERTSSHHSPYRERRAHPVARQLLAECEGHRRTS